ncbi:MAG: hypothetical protein IJM24_02655 [Clostridia bacterium]|nr:hypothetical protein [Clostridia bacterium]
MELLNAVLPAIIDRNAVFAHILRRICSPRHEKWTRMLTKERDKNIFK